MAIENLMVATVHVIQEVVTVRGILMVEIRRIQTALMDHRIPTVVTDCRILIVVAECNIPMVMGRRIRTMAAMVR